MKYGPGRAFEGAKERNHSWKAKGERLHGKGGNRKAEVKAEDDFLPRAKAERLKAKEKDETAGDGPSKNRDLKAAPAEHPMVACGRPRSCRVSGDPRSSSCHRPSTADYRQVTGGAYCCPFHAVRGPPSAVVILLPSTIDGRRSTGAKRHRSLLFSAVRGPPSTFKALPTSIHSITAPRGAPVT